MKITNNENNRLAIYFFFDKNGIVDEYVYYFLEDLTKNVKDTIIVSNGSLEKKGKQKLATYGTVLERTNEGFDVFAYKTALEYVGYENLAKYDEVILLNSTIMGPLFPFEETFKKMDKEDVDFWGITKYFSNKGDPSGVCIYGYMPDHIQSHWIAVRRSLLSSLEFKKYWDSFEPITNYWEAVGKHEMVFTKHFSDLGFSWMTSVPMEDLRSVCDYPLMMQPLEMIKNRRCPIFKRREFFGDPKDYLYDTMGEPPSLLFKYIQKETSYNVDLIWNTLLRNYNQADLVKNLNLTYILPETFSDSRSFKQKAPKIALIMHLYFPDLFDDMLSYAKAMPDFSDLYITTDSLAKKEKLEVVFKEAPFNKVEVRLIENRGRDVSSLLVGVKDVIMDYDIACFAHDKKSSQLTKASMGMSFSFKCFEGVLSSKDYVLNVIKTFVDNPRLGMLSPPEPNHGDFFPMIGNEWTGNYKNTKELAKKLGLTIPLDPQKAPITAYGTMFWFRPKAFKKLYDKEWTYEDFPPEPNNIDSTLLHAIERIYSFVAQDEGYYPGIVMPNSLGSLEYGNMRFYLRSYNQLLMDAGIQNTYAIMKQELESTLQNRGQVVTIKSLLKRKIKNGFRKILPAKLFNTAKHFYKTKVLGLSLTKEGEYVKRED